MSVQQKSVDTIRIISTEAIQKANMSCLPTF